MSRPIISLVALWLTTCATQALAVPLQITVQASLAMEEFATSFFGITDASVPIQISFLADDADAITRPAGTPVFTSTGAAFSSDAHLFTSASLTNFVAVIGTQSFTADDLRTVDVGNTSAFSHDLMLFGSLTEDGISGVQFELSNAFGQIQFGFLGCSATSCSWQNFGFGESWFEGAFADISSIQVFVQALSTEPPTSVPEPSTLGLLFAGLCAAFLFRRRAASSSSTSLPA